MSKRGFTLIELLVVIAVIAILLAIAVPSLRRARQQAQITVVNSDLYQIALGLEMYMNDNRGVHPPPRSDCGLGWDDRQLPPELVTFGYLPAPSRSQGRRMPARMEDPFNRGVTYKYAAVGPYYQNRVLADWNAYLWVPAGFPAAEDDPETDVRYDDPATSPVTWVIYSLGPNVDDPHEHERTMLEDYKGPVAKRAWYSPQRDKGLLVRLRMRNGTYHGSFQGHP